MGIIVRPIHRLDDVPDVAAPSPTIDQVLKWNGSAWVPAAYNATFELTISSFSGSPAQGAVLMGGAGSVWRAPGAMAFTAGYSGNTPTSASIALASNGGSSWASPLTLADPFTSGASTEAVNYPSQANRNITFTLTATDGSSTPTSTLTYNFGNYVRWGRLNKNSGFTNTDVTSLIGGGTALLAAHSSTPRVITGINNAGYYPVYAYPAWMADLAGVWSYRIGYTHYGTNLYSVMYFQEETVSGVSNGNGYTEDYIVGASMELWNHRFSANCSIVATNANDWFNAPNLFFWGTTANPGNPGTDHLNDSYPFVYTEEELKQYGIDNGEIENSASVQTNDDPSQQFTIDVPNGHYVIVAMPYDALSSWSNAQFWVNGLQGGFIYCGMRSISTPFDGNYGSAFYPHFIFRSTNHSLGQTTIVTSGS